jgi:effector-binding domain-containing protein
MAAETTCRVKTVAPQTLMVVQALATPLEFGQTLQASLELAWRHLNDQEHVTVGPAMCVYREMTAEAIAFAAGFPVAEDDVPESTQVQRIRLSGGKAATLLHWGPYGGLPDAQQRLAAWMAEHGLTGDGTLWEIYWADMSHVSHEAELRTELVAPLAGDGEADCDAAGD